MKAAKSSEMEAVNISSDEKESVSSFVEIVSEESATVQDVGLIGSDTSSVTDATVPFSEISKDSDSLTDGAVHDGVSSAISSQEEVLLSQPSDAAETVEDQDHVCAASSLEPTSVDGEAECEESFPRDEGIQIANTSDWESTSPVKTAFGKEVIFPVVQETPEVNKDVEEIEKDSKSLTEPLRYQLRSTDPNSQRNSLNGHVSGCQTGDNVPEDTGSKELNENEVRQGEVSDLGHTGAVSVDQPDLAKDCSDSVAAGEAVVSESSKVDNDDSGLTV